jgi:hypothetical protein
MNFLIDDQSSFNEEHIDPCILFFVELMHENKVDPENTEEVTWIESTDE